ncbi:MFS transporter [Parasphingorhabdus sp.]|uniref:MFS transporter n=1 Tax=Parasphingorhabdus sp. TaxID=2709688 RepID=UPI0032EBF140
MSNKTASLAYALPAFGMAFILTPALTVLSGIYVKDYGYALETVGLVVLLARLFDAVTDPVIAVYSDREYARDGARYRLIIAGFILFAASALLLYSALPKEHVAYFVVGYLLFYLGYTAFIIPYQAWGNEFTSDPADRLRAYSALSFFGQIGGIAFFALPMLPIWESGEFTSNVLLLALAIGTVWCGFSLWFVIKVIPRRSLPIGNAQWAQDAKSPSQSSSSKSGIPLIIQDLRANPPFWTFCIVMLCFAIAIGMWQGLFFIFVDIYMGMGSEYPPIAITGAVVGALSVPIWFLVARKIGSKKTWLISIGVSILTYPLLIFVDPADSQVGLLYAVSMLVNFSLSSLAVVALPLIAGISDYGTLKSGSEQNGVYFGAQGFLTKAAFAIGGGAGLAIAGVFGFDTTAPTQTADGLFAIRVGIVGAPIFFTILSGAIMMFFSLSEKRIKVIRSRLERVRSTSS